MVQATRLEFDSPAMAEQKSEKSETNLPVVANGNSQVMKLSVVVPMKDLIRHAEETASLLLDYTKPVKIGKGFHYECDDWKVLAAAFGIFASNDKPHEVIIRDRWGFECRGFTKKDGLIFTEAWHICLWEGREKPKPGSEDEKEYFSLYGKVQTRAQSRALRAAISWVVKIGSKKSGRKISTVPAELAQEGPEDAEFEVVNNNEQQPGPEIDIWQKILMLANGDEVVANKKLLRFLKQAGRDTNGKNSWQDLDDGDQNSIRLYVEAEFEKSGG